MPVISRYRRALLPLTLIALALSEATASAQGALTNGDTHTGTIGTPGQIDVWSFPAAQGDYIVLAIGEIVANPDPGFVPWMQLKNHDTGTVVTTVAGALAAQIAVNAPLTATYDVLVRDSNISRPGTALGSYALTLVKAPGSLVVHAGDQRRRDDQRRKPCRFDLHRRLSMRGRLPPRKGTTSHSQSARCCKAKSIRSF